MVLSLIKGPTKDWGGWDDGYLELGDGYLCGSQLCFICSDTCFILCLGRCFTYVLSYVSYFVSHSEPFRDRARYKCD